MRTDRVGRMDLGTAATLEWKTSVGGGALERGQDGVMSYKRGAGRPGAGDRPVREAKGYEPLS